MRYRDINPPDGWGETPDPGVAADLSSTMFLFALLPHEGAQSQDRAPLTGGRLVAAKSAADARLVAAQSESQKKTRQIQKAAVTQMSAFRDERLYRVEQLDTRPVEAEGGMIAFEFDEQCRSFLSIPRSQR